MNRKRGRQLPKQSTDATADPEPKLPTMSRQEFTKMRDAQDIEFGFPEIGHGPSLLGWLFNMAQSSVFDESGIEKSAINLYFMKDDGSGFRTTIVQKPYFYIRVKEGLRREVDTYLMRSFEGVLSSVETVVKEDLDLPNHIAGVQGTFLKLMFENTTNLMSVRKELMPIVVRNKARAGSNRMFEHERRESSYMAKSECLRGILDIREYDVPYLQRVCTDCDYRAGCWYEASYDAGVVSIKPRRDLLEVPELRVFAFDIETTKSPLRFPDAEEDEIMMISYMADGDGFLIVNRSIVSEDIDDFEYTPKPEFPGPFTIFNETDEKALLERFLEHISELRPHVFVTYNGDFFDWPFVHTRCKKHFISMQNRIGIRPLDQKGTEYGGRFAVHLDAFCWVRRDSYLPQGSQGLKAVTKALLSYNPLELDPEDMLPFASSRPQDLASYSVSDAVATYYLYLKYVHLFVFSLCTIIPIGPADVLRKGSGTLCEQLLMVEAYRAGIICPNKERATLSKLWNGRLLESETYIGGHVESLESGIFREDIPVKFNMDVEAIQDLINSVPDAVRFAVEVEMEGSMAAVTNADEISATITAQLEELRERPVFDCLPLIYHLDVGAMYPNIILTNRLQPMAIVDQRDCAACDFNVEAEVCQREMMWKWRGRHFTASRSEVVHQRNALELQSFPSASAGCEVRFNELPANEQAEVLAKAVRDYSMKSHRRAIAEVVEDKYATVCQREHSFYVDTVRAFRDRRYEYKAKKKEWSNKLSRATDVVDKQKAKGLVLLYDSMQLAHKCILNSFYGYVMRKGARWHSMEMAGIVTHTGANIIKDARIIIEKLGRALELDTDGIWCLLPSSFPDTFEICMKDANGTIMKRRMSFPGTMLNRMVAQNYTNEQYLTLTDAERRTYETSRQNSILFEVDGPYRAMALPAAQQQGKTLKKRYAVFNRDGSIAELKGFELKRRGELKLIKVFQQMVFPAFLHGSSLTECYNAVGSVANHWLDILERKGVDIDDDEVFDLLSESKNMSQALEDYGTQRSTAITTAKRLAEFLGPQMVRDKGLACRFIISKKPESDPVSNRAVPTAIFSAEEAIRNRFLCKWLQDPSRQTFDIRSILDWDYYTTRLGSAIQKIITIPAALQHVANPVVRVKHPDWLLKRVRDAESSFKQRDLRSFFGARRTDNEPMDIEDVLPNKPIVPKQLEVVEEPMPLGKDAPDMDKDFPAWHAYEKKRWKRLRSSIAGPAKTVGSASKTARLKGLGGMESFVQRDTESAAEKRVFHIVQLFAPPNGKPGNFLIWLYSPASSMLLCVPLQVERQFYVQWAHITPVEQQLGDPVSMVVPRGREPVVLHLISTDEETFQDSSRERSCLLSEGGATAFYETDVPLQFRVFTHLGAFCRPTQASGISSAKFAREGANLSDLEQVLDLESKQSYLSGLALKEVFLYAAGSDQRAVVCLLTPRYNSTTANFVFDASVVAVSAHGRPSDKPKLAGYVEAAADAAGVSLRDDQRRIHTTIHVVTTLNDAFVVVNDRLQHYLRSCPTDWASLVLCQTIFNEEELCSALPSLGRRVPFALLSPHSSDDQFEALSWLSSACRQMLQRWLLSGVQVAETRQDSAYSLVPVCNLLSQGVDQAKFSLDVMYARLLALHKHVLWNATTDVHVQHEEDFFADELTNPEIIVAGCYRSPVAEISIGNLAISAMLLLDTTTSLDEGDMIYDHEVSLASVAPSDNQNMQKRNKVLFRSMRAGGSALSSCSMVAVKALRRLVQNMLGEIVRTQDRRVDKLLSLAYSWLQSRQSLLHNPVIHQVVHELMHKLFLRLVAEFRAVGANIIYASFSRLIVHLKKPSIRHAQAFMPFAFRSVNEEADLQHLVFKTFRFWETLLFVDSANYGGVEYTEEDKRPEPQLLDEGDLSQDCEAIFMSGSWNMSSFLPALARSHFLLLVSELLQYPLAFQRRLYSDPDRDRREDRALLQAYTREFVAGHLTQRAFECVNELQSVAGLPGHSDEERVYALEFPDLPGAVSEELGPHCSAALALVKQFSYVLTLEKCVVDEAESFRTAVLQLCDCRAFSVEAQYRPVCRTFILPDISCPECGDIRDLDMCRDRELVAGNWRCPVCNVVYNKDEIEMRLVEVLQRRSTSYQVQDLMCTNCGKLQTRNLASACDCSGELVCRTTPDQFLQGLRTFESIARHYQMEWLSETIEMLLM